jgi:hypothetical protein
MNKSGNSLVALARRREWAWGGLAIRRVFPVPASHLGALGASPGSPDRCSRRRWKMGAERNLHSLGQVHRGLPRKGIVGRQS